jgi:hypothetical protein
MLETQEIIPCVKFYSQASLQLVISRYQQQARQPLHRISTACRDKSGAILATASSPPTANAWPLRLAQTLTAASTHGMRLPASGMVSREHIDRHQQKDLKRLPTAR